MAKDILYINEGTAINASWTNHIAISGDGNNWNPIHKAALSVGMYAVNFNTSTSNSYPERNKESGWVIVVKRTDVDGPILKFNPSKVLNQPAWISGTALQNATAALSDITSWLA